MFSLRSAIPLAIPRRAKSAGDQKAKPTQLRVGRHEPRNQRRHEQRRESRRRRTRLQVAHVRLERCALSSLSAFRIPRARAATVDSFLQRHHSSANLRACTSRTLPRLATPTERDVTAVKVYTSMGSPSAVPVPCASNAGPPRVSPSRRTDSRSRRCDDPFGAVRLALGPSCYTADLRTVARHARSAGTMDPFSQTQNAAHPSPRQYPSARPSNVWHRPSSDVIPATAVP